MAQRTAKIESQAGENANSQRQAQILRISRFQNQNANQREEKGSQISYQR